MSFQEQITTICAEEVKRAQDGGVSHVVACQHVALALKHLLNYTLSMNLLCQQEIKIFVENSGREGPEAGVLLRVSELLGDALIDPSVLEEYRTVLHGQMKEVEKEIVE